ncbi:MAG: hypothetical protein Q4E39_00720 [bacterium]|nr:hypothetical protein [bacterium]
MKRYLVTVRKIQTTSMYISENSMKKAIKKVDDLIQKRINNNMRLNDIFDKNPNFKYNAKLINKE